MAWPIVAVCVVVAGLAAWQDTPLVAACALALVFAGVVDEPAPELAVSAPTPVRAVRVARLVAVTPVAVAGWAAARAITDAAMPGFVELGALVSLALAAGAVGVRARPGLSGSAFAGPALLVVLVDGGRYLDGDPAWLAVLCASLLALTLATRDQAARPIHAPRLMPWNPRSGGRRHHPR